MKRNLKRTLEVWRAQIPLPDSAVLLQTRFVLAWFHAVVQVNLLSFGLLFRPNF